PWFFGASARLHYLLVYSLAFALVRPCGSSFELKACHGGSLLELQPWPGPRSGSATLNVHGHWRVGSLCHCGQSILDSLRCFLKRLINAIQQFPSLANPKHLHIFQNSFHAHTVAT